MPDHRPPPHQIPKRLVLRFTELTKTLTELSGWNFPPALSWPNVSMSYTTLYDSPLRYGQLFHRQPDGDLTGGADLWYVPEDATTRLAVFRCDLTPGGQRRYFTKHLRPALTNRLCYVQTWPFLTEGMLDPDTPPTPSIEYLAECHAHLVEARHVALELLEGLCNQKS